MRGRSSVRARPVLRVQNFCSPRRVVPGRAQAGQAGIRRARPNTPSTPQSTEASRATEPTSSGGVQAGASPPPESRLNGRVTDRSDDGSAGSPRSADIFSRHAQACGVHFRATSRRRIPQLHRGSGGHRVGHLRGRHRRGGRRRSLRESRGSGSCTYATATRASHRRRHPVRARGRR